MAKVRLRPGHVRPVWAGHPWVYAQAVASVDGSPGAGDVVDVLDAQEQWMGSGFYAPASAIAVRIVSRVPGERIDRQFFESRIARAESVRKHVLGLPTDDTTGYRLVHAEGDGLSGLIVDVYGKAAVVQLLSAGMKRRQAEVLAALQSVTGVLSVLELGSPEHQEREGFSVRAGTVLGPTLELLEFRERGFQYRLAPSSAQKTGFYFDQRENRERFERMCEGRRVLDLCCYLGAFSLAAARGGASEVLALDRSEPILRSAGAIARDNGRQPPVRFEQADIRRALPDLVARGERFDAVVLDPPKLAPSVRHVDAARKAYRAWNALALQLCTSGAVLVTCSCSAAMQPHDFLRTLALSSTDAQRETVLLALGQQAADHPTPPAFDEGRYLKAAFLRVG